MVGKAYGRAIKLDGKTATRLQWDDRIPTFKEVHHEALKANKFVEKQVETSAAENAPGPFTLAVERAANAHGLRTFPPTHAEGSDAVALDRREQHGRHGRAVHQTERPTERLRTS